MSAAADRHRADFSHAILLSRWYPDCERRVKSFTVARCGNRFCLWLVGIAECRVPIAGFLNIDGFTHANLAARAGWNNWFVDLVFGRVSHHASMASRIRPRASSAHPFEIPKSRGPSDSCHPELAEGSCGWFWLFVAGVEKSAAPTLFGIASKNKKQRRMRHPSLFLAHVERVECVLQLFQLLSSFAELTFRR